MPTLPPPPGMGPPPPRPANLPPMPGAGATGQYGNPGARPPQIPVRPPAGAPPMPSAGMAPAGMGQQYKGTATPQIPVRPPAGAPPMPGGFAGGAPPPPMGGQYARPPQLGAPPAGLRAAPPAAFNKAQFGGGSGGAFGMQAAKPKAGAFGRMSKAPMGSGRMQPFAGNRVPGGGSR